MIKKTKIKKRHIVLCVFAILLIVVIIWITWGNKALELNNFSVFYENLPENFDGFRIAHVSDLHNTKFGKNNEKLISMLKNAKPDIIAITGDIIDSYNTDISVAVDFAKEAVKIAPCYYVTGNHESRIDEFDALKKSLTDSGVIFLDDEKAVIERSGEYITIIGVNDPSFQTDYLMGDSKTVMENTLKNFETDSFTLLLSHRPELFDVYVENGIDLVLSGHAHGGQFRLPFFGGVFAPNQGAFPEYDSGIYTKNETNMCVSRGIGNSIIPFRINNRPEIILIELKTPQN